MKKRSYEAQIREVEHGTFTPLIFSATGGMADEVYAFYTLLDSLLSDKWSDHYAAPASLLGFPLQMTDRFICKLSFYNSY